MDISCLPNELLLAIFDYTTLTDLSLLDQVCVRWKALAPVARRKRCLLLSDSHSNASSSHLVAKSNEQIQMFQADAQWNKRSLLTLEQAEIKLMQPKTMQDLHVMAQRYPHLRKLEIRGSYISPGQLQLLLKRYWTCLEHLIFVQKSSPLTRSQVVTLGLVLNPDRLRHLALVFSTNSNGPTFASTYIPNSVLEGLESLYLQEHSSSFQSVINFDLNLKFSNLKRLALQYCQAGFNYLKRKITLQLKYPSVSENMFGSITHLSLHNCKQASVEQVDLTPFVSLQYLDIGFFTHSGSRTSLMGFLSKAAPSLTHLRMDILPNSWWNVFPMQINIEAKYRSNLSQRSQSQFADLVITPIWSITTLQLYASVGNDPVLQTFLPIFPMLSNLSVNGVQIQAGLKE